MLHFARGPEDFDALEAAVRKRLGTSGAAHSRNSNQYADYDAAGDAHYEDSLIRAGRATRLIARRRFMDSCSISLVLQPARPRTTPAAGHSPTNCSSSSTFRS